MLARGQRCRAGLGGQRWQRRRTPGISFLRTHHSSKQSYNELEPEEEEQGVEVVEAEGVGHRQPPSPPLGGGGHPCSQPVIDVRLSNEQPVESANWV